MSDTDRQAGIAPAHAAVGAVLPMSERLEWQTELTAVTLRPMGMAMVRHGRWVGVVALLCVLSACDAGGGESSASPTPSSSPSERTATEVAADEEPLLEERDHDLTGDWEELGPDGFLELRLGMTKQEASEVGLLALGERRGRCTGFYLAMFGDARPGPHGWFTRGNGLSVIYGQGEMHTPQDIVTGSPVRDVRDAYPSLAETFPGFLVAPMSRSTGFFFVIKDQSVSDFGLSFTGDPCLSKATGELAGLQGGAESAAEQIESGEGLRVKNQTGQPVTLVFADGSTARVDAGKVATLLMPCRERFPLHVESMTGEVIAEHDGPCRKRDTWTVD